MASTYKKEFTTKDTRCTKKWEGKPAFSCTFRNHRLHGPGEDSLLAIISQTFVLFVARSAELG